MPRDYKPFQPTFWDIRDWHTLEELTETFWYWSTTPLDPGAELLIDTITVPAGVKYHFTEVFVTTQFDGEAWYFIPTIGLIDRAFVSKNKPYAFSWSVPFIYSPETVAEVRIRNDDIIPGHWQVGGSVYKIPLSPMPKAKSDDPEEILRVRDFNFLVATFLPNGDQLKIFRRVKDDKANFIETENFGKPEQKIIAKGHLSLKDLDLITRNLREKPEKAIKILEKFEKGKAKTK